MLSVSRPAIVKPTIASIQPRHKSATWRVLRSRTALASIVVVVVMCVLALFADTVAPFTDHAQGELLDAPSGAREPGSGAIHWMGTDDLGRDIFTRLLYGTRISLAVGLAADVIITSVGVLVGLLAGYFGGAIDNLLMRLTDIMFAFPSLLFAMVLVATFGRSVPVILVALCAANWVTMARLVRGQVLQVRQMDYILSARSTGAQSAGIIWRHILPNISGPIIVFSTFVIPGVITAEAALAFLGIGIDPSIPTLGRLINAGMGSIFSHPGEVTFPVVALALLTLAFTLIGDAIRDVLDPRTN